MISRPVPGQPVLLWYAAPRRPIAPFHGRLGIVRAVAKGPGPRNHLVDVDRAAVVVPAGNLRKAKGGGE